MIHTTRKGKRAQVVRTLKKNLLGCNHDQQTESGKPIYFDRNGKQINK